MKLCVVIACILFLGCAKQPPQIIKTPPPPPKIEIEPPKPIIIPTYTYLPGGRRDPFTALIKPKKEVVHTPTLEPKPVPPAVRYEVDIETLRLTGLLWDKNECLALLQDGGGFGYILRGKQLYGPNFKPIKDISGFIRNNEEVVLAQGPNRVTLKLSETPKTSLEKGS